MPREHHQDCKCVTCFRIDTECCSKRFTTWPALSRHRKSRGHAERNPNAPPLVPRGKAAKRRTQVLIVPDGLGYLTSTLTTPERLSTVSLAAISRFAQIINDQRNFRAQRFSKRERLILEQLRRGEDAGGIKLTLQTPADQARIIYELAKTVNVPVQAILPLLLSYGLEYLARELRATKNAPTPKSPTPLVRETYEVLKTPEGPAAGGDPAPAVPSVPSTGSDAGVQRPSPAETGEVRRPSVLPKRFAPKRFGPNG